MPAPAAWPAPDNGAMPPDDHRGSRQPSQLAQAPSDEEAVHVVVGDLADLLRDTRWSVMSDGCLLGAITVGIALEAGHCAGAPRPALASVINLGLLAGILACWVTAAFFLAWANRPVLNAVNELRWRTGAPLDPRPAWVSLPPTEADPAEWTWDRAYSLVGAARLSRYRAHFADTWTYLTGACFLAWTVLLILGL